MATPLVMVVIGFVYLWFSVSDATFTTGCSFANDQCIYTVQLGHEKQCDKPSSLSSDPAQGSSCCNNVTALVQEMKRELDGLKIQVDVLTSRNVTDSSADDHLTQDLRQLKSELKITKETLGANEKELNATRQELQRVKDALNATQDELTSEKAKASYEIRDLHDRLSNCTKSLHMCQSAIGMETPSDSIEADGQNHTVFYCSFDEDSCDFTITSTPSSYRYFGRLATPIGGSGPATDHSKGVKRGHIMGLDAGQVASHNTGYRLRTSVAQTKAFPASPSYCIMFWYAMPGNDAQDLSVNLLINGGSGYPVFKVSGPQGDQWNLATVDLDSEYTSHNFQVVFSFTTIAYSTSYTHHNEQGSIAIDDVYIYNTTCNNVPRQPSMAYKADNNGTTSYYTFHTHPETWSDAFDLCRRHGPWSALISIDSQQEQDFIVNVIQTDKTLNTVGQSGFYTSGSDVDSEHQFTWTDTGIPRPVPSGFWHTGQPNNVGGDQDCLLLQYSSDDYRWGDVDCDTKHPFICEVTH